MSNNNMPTLFISTTRCIKRRVDNKLIITPEDPGIHPSPQRYFKCVEGETNPPLDFRPASPQSGIALLEYRALPRRCLATTTPLLRDRAPGAPMGRQRPRTLSSSHRGRKYRITAGNRAQPESLTPAPLKDFWPPI